MTEQSLSEVGQALVDSAETMAFISLLPAERPFILPPDMVRVSISFTGPFDGSVELAASAAFGALLAANMLGCDSSDADASARAADAMKELMNVTCGHLLSKFADRGLTGFEMGLPCVEPLADATSWKSRLEDEPTNVFDAEGHFLAVRLDGGMR